MRLIILDAHTLDAGDLDWSPLEALGEVIRYDRTPAELIVERSAGATAIFTNKTPLSADTLARLPDLKYIGVLAAGYNVVDIAAAAERGIPVTNAAGYGSASVAQHVFALILAFTNLVDRHDSDVKAGGWTSAQDWTYLLAPMRELAGKTLGIVGYGSIGRQTARIGQAFGMEVVVNTRTPDPDSPFDFLDIHEVFANSDVVSLHCPLTPQNTGFVNRDLLRIMRPDALLINTARGGLVNEHDLRVALDEGWIAGAGLDTLSTEPPLAENPLIGAPRCIVTPHIAWASPESRQRLLGIVAENLRAFQSGNPVNVVNRAGLGQ